MMQSTPSLKWNASANFVGLAYTTIIGIVVLPLYLQYLGSEAFGLIGFFLVLQAWLQLFDLGTSPMLSRQIARYRGRSTGYSDLLKLLRSLEIIAFGIAVVVFLGVAACSSWIASNWLNVAHLPSEKVSSCLVLMGLIIGLRFPAALYRSGIQGTENQVALNVANVIFVTMRFVGALFLLHYVTQDIGDFFVYQLSIGALELVALATMFYRFFPATEKIGVAISWRTLRPDLPFAGGMAYTAALWVIVTQLDKLVLSNILSLSEYGYFSLVAIVSAGISQIGTPISQAILPRMTYLLSKGEEEQMLLLYRQSTQLMAAIILPLAGVAAFFSTELLFAWTGDAEAASWAGPVLFWFALGSGILALSAFQFYLQFAHGQLKMHVIYNSIAAGIQIPVIIYVAYEYGVFGVALAWFILRLASFVVWTPIVHKKFARGIHMSWLVGDIGPSFAVTATLLLLVSGLDLPPGEMDRVSIFVTLIGIGVLMVVCNVLVSRAPRNLLLGLAIRRIGHDR
jgi:O-antigen/teichoic acid export membrane protein